MENEAVNGFLGRTVPKDSTDSCFLAVGNLGASLPIFTAGNVALLPKAIVWVVATAVAPKFEVRKARLYIFVD